MFSSLEGPQRDRILAEIEAAFGDVRRERGVTLHRARAMDDGFPSDVSCELDPEERWQDISDEKIDRFGDTMAFMDLKGFRFHLPRFMVRSLSAGNVEGNWGRDAAIYACCFSDELREHKLKLFDGLNGDQRTVIARYLRFVLENDRQFDVTVAARALDQFWNRYG
jgi:hypothetical protein